MLTLLQRKELLELPELNGILAASVYDPTPERLAKRVRAYRQNASIAVFACREADIWKGVAVVQRTGSLGTLLDIAVSEKDRKQGIGRFLISGIIKSLALTDFYAETDEEAVGFYHSLGFTVTSLGDKYNSGSQRYLCQKGEEG